MFNELAQEIHANALDKGFWQKNKNIPEKLMLIVSELGEACEALRNNNTFKNRVHDSKEVYGKYVDQQEIANADDWEGFVGNFQTFIKDSYEDELADTIIRLLDLCAFEAIDIDWHIRQKMKYNSQRGKLHGKQF